MNPRGLYNMKHIHVAAAIFIENEKVFAAQRKDSGELALKWEFPGGKLESGETGEEAIVREIMEELSATIEVEKHLMTVEHQYDSFSLTMDAYLCTVIDGDLKIGEHIDCRWLTSQDLYSVDWAAADIPIVDILATYLA
jgi:8-oxo-dGTP diphosphatase